MSKKVPCSKCGREYTTQGIKNHELRCDGTIPESKQRIALSEPDEIDDDGNVWKNDKVAGTRTYFPKETEEVQEIQNKNKEIHEHVSKSDIGTGGLMFIIILFAGLFILLSHAKNIIPMMKNKQDTQIPNTDNNTGWI
jgi:hypothetical protein